MERKLEERQEYLHKHEKELFEEYDKVKDNIRKLLSNDDIYPIAKLVEKLEMINVEIEYVQNEYKYWNSSISKNT